MVSFLLNVVTCCIRTQNLPKIAESFTVANIDKLPIKWYVILDNNYLKYSQEQIRKLQDSLSLSQEISVELLVFSQSLLHSSPINLALDQISNGLVCFIDDDNIMHPAYLKKIYELAKDKEEIGILYQQNLGREFKSYNRHIRHIIPYSVIPGCVDTAQLTISRSLIGSYRWPVVQKGTDFYHKLMGKNRFITTGEPHQPDGIFISTLYAQHKTKFFIVNEPLCYYNYLSSNLDFS